MKTLAAGTGPGEFRTYVGYCGWGAGQLETEMKLGAWYIFDGNARLIFRTGLDVRRSRNEGSWSGFTPKSSV